MCLARRPGEVKNPEFMITDSMIREIDSKIIRDMKICRLPGKILDPGCDCDSPHSNNMIDSEQTHE